MCGEVCCHRPLGVDSLRQSLYVIVHRQRVWNTYLISLQEVSVTVAPSGTRRIALFLMGELVAALRANDSDLFKRWLYGGIEDL